MQATSQTIIVEVNPQLEIIQGAKDSETFLSFEKSLAQRACTQLNDVVDAYFATLDASFHRQYASDMNILFEQISLCGYSVELTDEDGFVLIA